MLHTAVQWIPETGQRSKSALVLVQKPPCSAGALVLVRETSLYHCARLRVK